MTFRRRKSSRPTTALDHFKAWARNPVTRAQILLLSVAYAAVALGAVLVLGMRS